VGDLPHLLAPPVTEAPKESPSAALLAGESPSAERVKAKGLVIESEPFQRPAFAEDNARARPAMRWPDDCLAYIEKHPVGRLVSLDSIEVLLSKTAELRRSRRWI
jgi:hypothetical protein